MVIYESLVNVVILLMEFQISVTLYSTINGENDTKVTLTLMVM